MFFFFSSRRRHTRLQGDWSSDVCSSDLATNPQRASSAYVPSLQCTAGQPAPIAANGGRSDRKSTRLNSSHLVISYAVFCLKKKKQIHNSRCISLYTSISKPPSTSQQTHS